MEVPAPQDPSIAPLGSCIELSSWLTKDHGAGPEAPHGSPSPKKTRNKGGDAKKWLTYRTAQERKDSEKGI